MEQTFSNKTAKEFLWQLQDLGEEELYLRAGIIRHISNRTSELNGSTELTREGTMPKPVSDTVSTVSRAKNKAKVPQNPELEKFYQEIKDCTKCRLHKGRTKFVFGVGNPKAEVMFIGEGPGREEDLKGEPFVGRAGQLLDKILASIGLDRQTVYIANMVKCRPPENRDPQPDEMETCFPYLQKQIELIRPKIICCLGRISGQYLLKTSETLGRLRGKVHDFNASTSSASRDASTGSIALTTSPLSTSGVKLIVTYHPAALLRYPEYKKETWEDMKLLRKLYEELQNNA
jgi:DNA polymerase